LAAEELFNKKNIQKKTKIAVIFFFI